MAKHIGRLPSYQCAVDLVETPTVNNSLRVLGSWVGRSLIVAAGMGVAGKSFEDSVKNGLIAATAIEVFVLGHAVYSVNQTKNSESTAEEQSQP